MSKKANKTNQVGFGFGLARSMNDYRRTRGNKAPGKVIVIVCEGQETEPNYFRALRQKFRLRTLNVRVVPGKGAPISVVNCAIDEKKRIEVLLRFVGEVKNLPFDGAYLQPYTGQIRNFIHIWTSADGKR